VMESWKKKIVPNFVEDGLHANFVWALVRELHLRFGKPSGSIVNPAASNIL
jgi:hypothetical protein